MYAIKCDICGDEVKKDQKHVTAGYGYKQFELCPSCGWEIVDFLHAKELIGFIVTHEN